MQLVDAAVPVVPIEICGPSNGTSTLRQTASPYPVPGTPAEPRLVDVAREFVDEVHLNLEVEHEMVYCPARCSVMQVILGD
jgi:hypothetical protein